MGYSVFTSAFLNTHLPKKKVKSQSGRKTSYAYIFPNPLKNPKSKIQVISKISVILRKTTYANISPNPLKIKSDQISVISVISLILSKTTYACEC
ncbi:hypothetical protein QFZ51_002847 [Chitinophaga sp. W3I9]